jgi:hypothetical protein
MNEAVAIDDLSPFDLDEEGEPTVPPVVYYRAEKRKRDEEEDEYVGGDEEEVVNIIDKDVGGPLGNVFNCLWTQSREVGYEFACRLASDLYNNTVYKIDEAAEGRLVPGRRRMLTKPMTKSAMMRLADNLLETRDGTETAITLKMRYLSDCMRQYEDDGLWRQKNPHEPMFMSEKASKAYFKLLEMWIKLKQERDKEIAKRDKLTYERASRGGGGAGITEIDDGPGVFRKFD